MPGKRIRRRRCCEERQRRRDTPQARIGGHGTGHPIPGTGSALSLPTLEPQEDANGYDGKALTAENGALPFKTGTREGYPGGNTPSENSILDKIRCVKNGSDLQEKFSLDHEGDGAVEIEAHTDKYAGTKRMDPNLKRNNKLYVTVTVKNEAGISSRANAASWASTRIHNTPASTFSIADVM